MFKHLVITDNISSYCNHIYNQFIINLSNCVSYYDYCEMISLLEEWIYDYIGNMNNNETELFLIKYGYREALFNYIYDGFDITYYCDKQYQLNRILICNIIYIFIYNKIYNYKNNQDLNIFTNENDIQIE